VIRIVLFLFVEPGRYAYDLITPFTVHMFHDRIEEMNDESKGAGDDDSSDADCSVYEHGKCNGDRFV
jgi:hypothetical protein